MPRDYRVYLEDVSEAIGRVARYVSGLSREAFSADERTLDAVVRNLEIIGEAIKKVPVRPFQQSRDRVAEDRRFA